MVGKISATVYRTAAPAAGPLGPDPERAVRDIYEGHEVSGHGAAPADTRRLLERMLTITGDATDALQNTTCVVQHTRADERIKDTGQLFERLLLAADGMHSEAVRTAFQRVRQSADSQAAASRLCQLAEACQRDMRLAIQYDMLLSNASAEVGQAAARLIARVSDHRALQAALPGVLQVETLQALTRLVETADLPAALADVQMARQAAPQHLAEAIHLVRDMRSRGADGAAVQAGLGLVFSAPDGAVRQARLDVIRRLLDKERRPQDAAEDAGWIVALQPGADLDGPTDRMEWLLERIDQSRRTELRALFQDVEQAVSQEPQGWFSRLIGRTHPTLQVVEEILGIEGDLAAVRAHVQAVKHGQRAGESLQQAYNRYKRILFMDELDAPDAAPPAFSALSNSGALCAPEAAFERFNNLARLAGSVRGATAVWSTCTTAATHDEAHARERAFYTLVDEVGQSDAVCLYSAACQELGPRDSLQTTLRLVRSLHEKMPADVAASTYRSIRAWRTLPGNPFKTVSEQVAYFATIFKWAEHKSQTEMLKRRLETPVASETLFDRADILRSLTFGLEDVADAVRLFDMMAKRLPRVGDFRATGEAFAALVGALHDGNRAFDMLDWLEKTKKTHAQFKDVPLPDMIQKIAGILLLERDIDKAKGRFVKVDKPAGDVHQGDTEVVIGGISVPRQGGEEE